MSIARERHTVKADTFPIARPNARPAAISRDVDFIVEFWVIDHDFVRVYADDAA